MIGSALGLGAVALTVASGGDWVQRLATDTVLGPSAAAVGVALAASARLGVLLRRRLRVGLIVVLVMLALYSGSLPHLLRLMAGLVGLVLGPVPLGRARDRARPVVSGPETRILVAPAPPDPAAVAAICSDPATAADDCASLLYRLRLGGLGPAIMSVLPVLVLLVLADGLRRGRRFAWHATTWLNVGFAVLGGALTVLTASTPAERLVAFGGAADRQFFTGVITSIAQPLAVVALLYATRTRFRVRAPVRAYRGPAITITATLVTVSIVYLVASLIVSDQYLPQPALLDLLADLPTRFLPPGYLGEIEISFLPVATASTCSTSGPGWCSGSSPSARRCGC